MKVHTQFIINMLLFSIILLVVGFFVVYSFVVVGVLNKQEDLARSIELEAYNLDHSWNDYIKNEISLKDTWHNEYEAFSDNIAKLNPDIDEVAPLVNRIKINLQSIKVLYDEYLSPSTRREIPSDISIHELSVRMHEYGYNIITASSSLSLELDHRSDDMYQLHTILLLTLLIILGGFLFTTYIIVSRRILKSIAELVKGTRIVGTGNLDFSFANIGKDELGELAQSFNQMVSNLKNVTASKRDLENEITVRKSVEAELRQSSLELETANKEMEAFAYSVSHDLRAPLRSIAGFSSLLQMHYGSSLDAKGKEYLDYVSQSTHLMERLLEDILGLYRITHVELHPSPVDLSKIANEVKVELERNDPERKVEFMIMPGMTAVGDELLLKLVLQNLMGNAFKFTGKREDAKIEVGTTVANLLKTFFVRDNGAGFDMEFANKLFKPFQRLHTPAEFPGTGIGLASVQRIIERHGGKVWAEAELDKGATFYFTLPGM